MMLGLFWLTAYGPRINGEVMSARLDLAMRMQQSHEALKNSREWIRIDRWSPEPAYQYALVNLQIWEGTGDDGALPTFRTALAESIARDPKSHARRRQCGDLNLRVWRLSGDSESLAAAIDHYARSVELYPNGSGNRAQLAWSLHLAGRDDDARIEAARALDLDGRNPHFDQKLANQSVFDVPPPPPLADRMPPFVDGVDPELRMVGLRKGDDRSE
jgi:tetratricopeptide (TPR) repeat protein